MAVQYEVANIHGVLWKVCSMPLLYSTFMLSCFHNYSGQSPAFGFCSFEIGLVKVISVTYPPFQCLHHSLTLFFICSSHLQDLKEITHDFLYENYRTEKLSRTVDGGEQE